MRLTPRPPDPLDFSLSTITYYNRHRIPQTRVAHTHSLGWAFFLGIWRNLEHLRNPILSTDKPFYTLGLSLLPSFLFAFFNLCPAVFWYISSRYALPPFLIPFLKSTVYQKSVFICSPLFVITRVFLHYIFLSVSFSPFSISVFTSLNAFCCMCILFFQSSLYPQTSQTTSRIYIIVTETIFSSKWVVLTVSCALKKLSVCEDIYCVLIQ